MFGGDLEKVFQVGDPDQMADRLEGWQREFNRQVEGFDRVQRAAADLRVTETGVNGGLRVTVDVAGQVVDIVTTAELDAIRTEEIGPAVLACMRRARETMAARFAETAKETLGDEPMAAQLAEQYRQRFPEAEAAESGPAPARPIDEEEQAAAPIQWEEA